MGPEERPRVPREALEAARDKVAGIKTWNASTATRRGI